MNTTLSTAPGRHDHPPQPTLQPTAQPTRRVNLLDRAALHLGVALIKWGRRPHSVAAHERRANRAELRLARLEQARQLVLREHGEERDGAFVRESNYVSAQRPLRPML